MKFSTSLSHTPYPISHIPYPLSLIPYPLSLGVVGATGLVGEKLLKILEERNIFPEKLFLYASEKSLDKEIIFNKRVYPIISLSDDFINDDWDVLFFSAGKEIALKYAPKALGKARLIIDNSPAFRMEDNIPLVVPQVNGELLNSYKGIIANPNCTTIQLVIILSILQKKFGLKSVNVSTYQAVSGAGKKRLMYLETNGLDGSGFEREIINNLIPKIGDIADEYYFTEEEKIIRESRKILSLPNLKITSTCVRIPIKYEHSENMTVELEKESSYEKIFNELIKEKIVRLPENRDFFTPLDCEDNDFIYVSRLRRAFSDNRFWNLFIISDNLRRGAAANTVDILEYWVKR